MSQKRMFFAYGAALALTLGACTPAPEREEADRPEEEPYGPAAVPPPGDAGLEQQQQQQPMEQQQQPGGMQPQAPGAQPGEEPMQEGQQPTQPGEQPMQPGDQQPQPGTQPTQPGEQPMGGAMGGQTGGEQDACARATACYNRLADQVCTGENAVACRTALRVDTQGMSQAQCSQLVNDARTAALPYVQDRATFELPNECR